MEDIVKDMTAKLGKLNKFEGNDFRRWHKKMHFLLTTLKVVYVLSTPMPEVVEDEMLEQTRKRCKWENKDYICRGHILNEETLRAKESDKRKGKEIPGSSSVNMIEDAKLVTSKRIVVLKRTVVETLLVRDKDLSILIHHKDDVFAWWIDSGATCHACKDRCWFNTFHPVQDGSVLHMGDESTKPILGRGNVVLEFGFGKPITLVNVVYVSGLRKNLMSGPVLNKCGYKQVYESDKYILSRHGVFVGFGYYNNGMFMLNLNKVPNTFSSVCMNSYKDVDSSMWHARLGHVHYKRMLAMSKDNLIPEFDITLEKLSRDAMFYKKRFTSIPRPKSLMPSANEDQIGETLIEIPTTRRSNRAKVAKSFIYDFQLYLVEGSRDEIKPQYSYSYGIKEDPRTFDEAMQSCNVALWKKAINDEMDSIMKNNTWILSDLSPCCKPLGCKWIFKRKMKVDGTIIKFKARLVIQCFRQKERIAYFDTYAPVARISIIRLLIALAATYNLVIYQMDVKTSFLNGDLKKESDKCVYCKFDKSGNGVIICLYVDDMLIFGTDQDQVDKTKEFLSSYFSMKEMGEAGVILGIKIKREDSGRDVDQLEYSRAIGCLMYAMRNTRPDIAYAMGKLSSWITNSEDHTSTTGWVFSLGGGAISWASKKQTCITDSTMEAEFVDLAAAGKEAEWLRNLIYEIPLWPKPISSIFIHCDSATTLAKAYCQI
ncbi:zinc finger, CCHC-type containing protein [Tanacetum coccineum]